MALLLGGESESARPVFWLGSAARQLNSASPSTPPKPTSALRQPKCSAAAKPKKAIQSTETKTADMTLTGIVSGITSLDMLTKEIIETIKGFDEDRVCLSNLKLSSSMFSEWTELYGEQYKITTEYDAATERMILKTAPSKIHSGCANVFSQWFQEIADHTTQGSGTYFGGGEEEVTLLGDDFGDTKVPDAVLGNSEIDEPIVACEVGFTESLEDLFDDAQRLLSGSKGRIQAVILVKIFEEGRGKPVGPPWGLSTQQLRERLADNSLKRIVVDWHRNSNTPLIGELTVHLYLWSSERKNPPPHPLWRFKCGRNTPEQSGVFTTNIRNPLLDANNHLKILGGVFPLPMEKLEKALQFEVRREERRRAMKLIKNKCYV